MNKRWNTELALSASCTHGLIAQSVTASERNSVAVGWNHTQANFIIYILKLNVFTFQQCYCLHIPVTRFALGRAHQCYLFMNSKHHKSDFFQVAIQLFVVTIREIYKRTQAVFQLSYRQPLWILLCAKNSAVES